LRPAGSLNRLAALVTRLQSRQSLTRTARQLPDLSTTVRVEPSSTRETRLAGRTPKCKSCPLPLPGRTARHKRGRPPTGRTMLRWCEVRLAKTALKFVWPECDSVRLARTDRAAAPPL